MPINLTTPVALGNGTRLVVRSRPDEDAGVPTIEVTVSLRSAAGTDIVYAERTIVIRNGRSDQLQRVTLSGGFDVHQALTVVPGALLTPAGVTNAMVQWRISKPAFEAHLLSVGYLHSSLAGT